MNERQTLAILFYLRRDKKNRDNKVPIYLRITVNGKRSEMATNRYTKPEKWSSEGESVKGTKKEIRELNEHLDILRKKVYDAQHELMLNNKPVTAKALRNFVQGKSETQKTLLEVFDYHNKRMQEKVPFEYAPATLKRFFITRNHIKEFVKHQYKTDDLFLNQLNHEFITSLEHFFKVVKSCNHNTSIKYIKNLKKVINMAKDNDWINKDPFSRFSVKIKPVKRDYLDAEELKSIEEMEIDIPRLSQVRDIFIFSCYTGLAYSDVEKLSQDNIRKGIDGSLWIFTDRTKTSVKSNIPLLPKAQEIIDKYKAHPICSTKGKLLPILSNQKMNAYLKEIAVLAKIKKLLTFHLARHTFATTVTLANGVSIETVSEMLGHKSIRTTQIYAKVIDKKVSEEMSILKRQYQIMNNS